MSTDYYLTIAIFDQFESIKTFITFIEKELNFAKIGEKKCWGLPFESYKLDDQRYFPTEFLEKNKNNTLHDFTFFTDYCIVTDQDICCTHYQYKVDFPEYYRFYLRDDEPTENIYNHGVTENDFILNFFIYFDSVQKKYIYYQYLTSDIYFLINEYTYFKYDNEKYWAEINLDFEQTTLSKFWSYYEDNIKKIFNPKILIDGMVQNSKEYIDAALLHKHSKAKLSPSYPNLSDNSGVRSTQLRKFI